MLSKYEQFSMSISSLYHDIQRIERMEMAKYDMKGSHAQCVLAISRYPEGITAARLCEACEKDKAAISRTLAELEQMGMVRRSRPRYRACLTLTERGMEIAKAVNQTAHLAVERAGDGLDDSRREVFYGVLGLITENLHALCRSGLSESITKQKG